MRKIKGFRFVYLFLVIMLLFTGCGKKSMNYAENTADSVRAPQTDSGSASKGSTNGYGANVEGVPDFTNTQDANSISKPEDTTAGDGADPDFSKATTSTTGTTDKIIYRYSLTIETQDFDKLLSKIDSNITSLGGYTENSQIGGKSYYNDDVTRNGNITVRIPGNKAGEFIAVIKKAANVTQSQQSSENVSLQYIDAKSKVETLRIEQDRLYEILKTAKELDSIITLETRLSDIRYELEKYESQIRLYDNQVAYSYITLNIQEVERITPAKEIKQNFFSKIKNGFGDTLYNLSEGFQAFMVWFIVNIPYFLIWGAILYGLFILTRKLYRKYNKKPTQNTALYTKLNQQNPVDEIKSREEQNNGK
jgi:hypothetical protein